MIHTTCPAEILNVAKLGSDNNPDAATKAIVAEAREILSTTFSNNFAERWVEVDASPELWAEASKHSFTSQFFTEMAS